MQGVDNLFEVDTVQNIMKHIMQIAGVKYHEDEKKDVSLRVITDHIRSTTFMIGDGLCLQTRAEDMFFAACSEERLVTADS